MIKNFSSLKDVIDYVQDHHTDITEAAGVIQSAYLGYMSGKMLLQAVVNDAGKIIGWVKSSAVASQGAAATASAGETGMTLMGTTSTWTAGEVYAGDVIAPEIYSQMTISELGLESTASGAVAGDTAAGVAFTPKTVVLCSVAAALGLTIGFDTGRAIVAELTDTEFDWGTDSIGAQLLTYITGDGRSYVDEDLVERLKEYFIEHGFYANGGISGDEVNTQNQWQVVPTINIVEFLNVMCSKLTYPSGKSYSEAVFNICLQGIQAKMLELFTNLETNYGVSIDNIGVCDCSINFKDSGIGSIEEINVKIHGVTNNLFKGSYSNAAGGSGQLGGQPDTTNKYFYVEIGNYKCNSNGLYTTSTSYAAAAAQNVTTGLYFATNGLDNPVYTSTIVSISAMNIGRTVSPVPGVNVKPGATVPSAGVPISTTYPTWFNNWKYRDDTGETPHDNTKDKRPLVPVVLRYKDPEDVTQPEAQDGTNTDYDKDRQTQSQNDIPGNNDRKPSESSGTTPDPTTPTSIVGDFGLIRAYNPTDEQLQDFTKWLWTGDFVQNLAKLFRDPMQAILGLHIIYVTPSYLSGVHAIRVGNLTARKSNDDPIEGPNLAIGNQYVDVDCGTITISEYYQSVLDYLETDIQLFLPFIGFIPISAAEVMGKSVNIKITVDVLTGTCLYRIIVDGRQLYTYAGNCSVEVPLSSENYSQIISQTIGAIGGTVMGGLKGGVAGMAKNAATSALGLVTGSHVSVERSGSIGSNAGAMGIKKPYIVITRKVPYNPDSYEKYYGRPANTEVYLGNVHGFTRVKDINLSRTTATDAERRELVQILKEGVFI